MNLQQFHETRDEPWTCFALSLLLAEFAAAFALPFRSADEMLIDILSPETESRATGWREKVEFLEWFAEQWQDAESREWERENRNR